MGSCIICGTSVDGHICDVHEEDAVFEFRGDSAEQLTPGRYYRGSVDGFAEFGVFIDIGDEVTGLLHQSELDSRLESLDWQPGETVYVRVTNVRDNGNVDLSWSIRQSDEEFRGVLIDDPDADHELLPEETKEGDKRGGETTDDNGAAESVADEPTGKSSEETPDRPSTGSVRTRSDPDATVGAVGDTDTGAPAGEEFSDDVPTADSPDAEREPEPPAVDVGELDDWIGDDVRLTGEIVVARQTSGPTVFELRDGTGTVDCAAFVEAGVRAYPSVGEGDVVEIDGEVRERRGDLQVETEGLTLLADDERESVLEEIEAAIRERARPEKIEPLVDDEAVAAEDETIADAVEEIRRAVLEDRPVIVRHSATADGYVGGAAIERAVLPLVRERHDRDDAEYHYIDRRPIEGDVYGLDDATTDITRMLSDRERHDEKLPLLVFVAAGGTAESADGFELLDVYDVPRIVIDTVVEPAIADIVETALAPTADATAIDVADGTTRGPTATVMAATVATHVSDVREDLVHLPAVSYWGEVPESYAEAAADAGYDATTIGEIREAIALGAYYQSYEDKRELVADLLFGERDVTDEDIRGLASHVSEQFRENLGVAVETAEANLERRTVEETTIGVLDLEQFTHGYDFPPATLLLDELYRRLGEDLDAIVGLDADELHVRSKHSVDVRDLAASADEAVGNADLEALSTRSHRVEFLAGQRESVREAVLEALAASL